MLPVALISAKKNYRPDVLKNALQDSLMRHPNPCVVSWIPSSATLSV